MRQALNKRLAHVAQVFGNSRIPTDLVRQHFETFRRTGELPVDKSLAVVVHQRVRRGHDLFYLPSGEVDWPPTCRAMHDAPMRADDEVMDMLLLEAVYGMGGIRTLARCALVMLAVRGLDVTTTLFAGTGVALPEFTSVGAELMEGSGCLFSAPYEAQAERLLVRRDEWRTRVPRGDHEWVARMSEAVDAFVETGTRPSDDLMLDSALITGELNALLAHTLGRDVHDTLVAFDVAATTTGDARDAAIGQLQRIAGTTHFIGEAA